MRLRRDVLSLVVAGASALGGASAASAASPDVVYVSTLQSGLQAYRVGPTGALSAVAGSPFSTGNGGFGISVTPDRRHLFVSDYGDEKLSAFGVAPGTGALAAVTGSPFATGQAILSAVTPDGRFLYVAEDGSPGRVEGYAIDHATGALTAVPGASLPAHEGPYGVAVSHDGAFLYVTNSPSGEAGSVSVYRIAADGSLTEIDGSPFAAGTDSAGLVITPDDKRVYAANSFSEDISAWSRDPATGRLTPLPGSPFPAGPSGPTGLVVTPDGAHLYAVDSSQVDPSQNFIVGYDIDAATGGLDAVPGSPFDAGIGATLGALTADGSKLYVTDNGAGLSGYSVDAATGRLTELPDSPFDTAANPLGIAVSAPPPTPVGPTAAVASLDANVVQVGRRGIMRVPVRCTGTAGQTCTGQITLRGGGAGRLTDGSFGVPAGRSAGVRLTLNPAGRALLQRQPRVLAQVTFSSAGAGPVIAHAGLRAAHAPGALIRRTRPQVSGRGRFRLRVRCAGPAPGPCQGRLVVRTRKGRIVAARRLAIAAGGHRRIAVRLRPRGRALLARDGSLRMVARTRMRVPVGVTTVRRRDLTLH